MEETKRKGRVWDIILLKDSGTWEGFRAPEKALNRTVNYIVVLFIVASLSLVGWLWSRWELGRTTSELNSAMLENRSLRDKVKIKEQGLILGKGQVGVSELTFIPRLDGQAVLSEDLTLESFKVSFDPRAGAIDTKFSIKKEAKSPLNTDRLYWVLLVHGAQGLRAFPPAMLNRQGAWIHPQKGQLLENLRKERKVSGHFQLESFFDSGTTDPSYATLVLYDHRGSLLLKQREDITLETKKRRSKKRNN